MPASKLHHWRAKSRNPIVQPSSRQRLYRLENAHQVAVDTPGLEDRSDATLLQVQAAQAFVDDLAADRVPSVHAIRARPHVGQPRAQRVRAYLAGLTKG
jgi:hypothetical protein